MMLRTWGTNHNKASNIKGSRRSVGRRERRYTTSTSPSNTPQNILTWGNKITVNSLFWL